MRRASWGGIEWHLTRWGFGIIGWPVTGGDLFTFSASVMLGPCSLTFDFDRPVTGGTA